MSYSVVNCKTADFSNSDHSAIIANVDIQKMVAKKQKRISRDLRKLRSNPAKFLVELAKIDWNKLEEGFSSEPFKCSECDLKVQHETVINKEKPFNCSHCKSEFMEISDLKKHECDKPLNCSRCDMRFKNEIEMKLLTWGVMNHSTVHVVTRHLKISSS